MPTPNSFSLWYIRGLLWSGNTVNLLLYYYYITNRLTIYIPFNYCIPNFSWGSLYINVNVYGINRIKRLARWNGWSLSCPRTFRCCLRGSRCCPCSSRNLLLSPQVLLLSLQLLLLSPRLLLSLVHITGNPWVILGPPRPNPDETHTRSHGSGFIRVGVWVLVSHHITSSPKRQPHVLLTTTTTNNHMATSRQPISMWVPLHCFNVYIVYDNI